jgi:flavin-dependent dehydrogenase
MKGRRYEVVISGSGPAGAGLALALAARAPALAPEVLVLEAGRHPREKPCAGGITADGVRKLGSWDAVLDVPSVSVKGVRLRSGERVTDLPAPDSEAVVVRRDAFDASLVRQVRERGIEVREETPVLGVARHAEGVEVGVPGGSIAARCVVGADGVAGAVRRSVGFPRGRRHARLLVIETPPAGRDAGRTCPRFEFDFSCVEAGIQGYVWDFPCLMDGRPAVSRGIFDRADDAVRRRDWKRVFAGALHERGIDPGATRWKGFPERAFDPRLPTAAHRVLLVGDAAGIDPLLGEGIAQCFDYADLAADSILKARRAGDYAFRDHHDALLRSPLGRELRLRAFAVDHLYDPRRFPFWISLLFSSGTVRGVVGEALAEGSGFYRRKGRIALAAIAKLLLPGRA